MNSEESESDGEETKRLLSSFKEQSSGVSTAKYILTMIALICFTFAGMNAIFAVYFNNVLGLSQSTSGLLTNLAFFFNYGLAILGGVLADSWLGHYKTLLFGLVVTCAGMAVFIVSELGLRSGSKLIQVLGFVGCFVFVFGNGIAKPSTSAFLGDQFRPHEEKVRSTYFSWYYLVIQLGSIVSTIGIPFLFQLEPVWITFVALASMTVVALPVFMIPSGRYTKTKPQGNMFLLFLKILGKGMTESKTHSGEHWLDKAKRFYPSNTVEDVKVSLRVLKIFVLMLFFWGSFFQMYSMWVFLAESMDRRVTLHKWTFTIPAPETLSLNPLLDCILIPLFAKAIYPLFEKVGLPLTSLKRIGLGILFTSAALAIAGFVQLAINRSPPHSVSVAWIIPPYVAVSCAEVLLSVTAYEFAYTQAPKTMKGLLTALWLATVALGNVLVIIVQLIPFEAALMYFFMAGVIVLVFFAFLWIARSYSYVEEAPPSPSVNTD